MRSKICCFIIIISVSMVSPCAYQKNVPRIIILTDIGQDPDDEQSMVRLLHYANEFDIEGLIATADNNSSRESAIIRDDLIDDMIDKYALCEPNFKVHSDGFPDAQKLYPLVKKGSDKGGNKIPVEKFIGEGFDTEGSEWIISVVDRKDDRLVNVTVWGGACDLAQALWKVKNTRSKEATNQFVKKLRVFFIGKQDTSNEWIIDNFPKLWLILALDPSGDKWQSGYRGVFWGGDMSNTTQAWIHQNIHQNPLGKLYPDKAYTGGKSKNPHMAMKEGDSPSLLYFLDNGINVPSHPEWGGWGGRYFPEKTNFFCDDKDRFFDQSVNDTIVSSRATVFRWREDFQHDFAARVIWGSTENYKEANHPPIMIVNKNQGNAPLHIQAKAGEILKIDASQSFDPDGNQLVAEWFFYQEAGTFTGHLPEIKTQKLTIDVNVPENSKGTSIHLICSLKDDGKPVLSGYKRIILEIE